MIYVIVKLILMFIVIRWLIDLCISSYDLLTTIQDKFFKESEADKKLKEDKSIIWFS